MGLDMYLNGNRYLSKRKDTKHARVGETYRLGYWRKHPNLHGFIVQNFADGIDDCREISIGTAEIHQILAAIQGEQLPPTSGFFFGRSDGTEKANDIAIFTEALNWLITDDEDAWRSITYQASW